MSRRSTTYLMIIVIATLIILMSFYNTTSRSRNHSQHDVMDESHGLNKIIEISPKRIILWNNFFKSNWGFSKGVMEKVVKCPRWGNCLLSINRSNPLDGDAIIFHMQNSYTVPVKRDPRQIYVMYGWEAPPYRGSEFHHGNKFYNWTLTYSKKSDVSFPNGYWSELPKDSPEAARKISSVDKKRTKRRATVAWIVSNCESTTGRERYVKRLKKYIAVDIWGKCGKPCPKGTGGNNVDCFKVLGARYKFYLAFENSACLDYISFNPFRALEGGMLPIVLGGLSASDYVGLLPPNSYLDVRNFTSPKHLAHYLQMLDGNDEQYHTYHAWRSHYRAAESSVLYDRHWCHLCDALHNKTMVSMTRNVDWKLFWNTTTMCNANLVSQLLYKLA